MPDDYNGTPVPDNQNPDPGTGDQNDNIPEWMKDAGWETSSGTFDESKPVFDDLDDDDDEIVPADIPAWLEEAAPEGFNSDPNATPAFEGLDVDEPFITTGDLVPPPSMKPPVQEAETDEIEETEPEAAAADDGPDFDIPTWLENLELHEDSQETAIAWLENMPESLRATEEEVQAAQEIMDPASDEAAEPVDELAWLDEIPLTPDPSTPVQEEEQAELSEDLVASDLLPESGAEDPIFRQDEIQSIESELPSWLKELGEDQSLPPEDTEEPSVLAGQEIDDAPTGQDEMMPDWLRSPEGEPAPQAEESPSVPTTVPSTPEDMDEEEDIPDWLGEFEADSPDEPDPVEKLDREESIEETPADAPLQFEPAEETAAVPEPALPDEPFPQASDVSPNDETLNAQVPDWLSKIGEMDAETAEAPPDEPVVPPAADETSSTWLDQLSEQPLEDSRESIPDPENEVVDWLQEMDDQQADPPEEIDFDLPDFGEDEPTFAAPADEQETATYLDTEDDTLDVASDDLPDWLAELGQDDDEEDISLEDAIRKSDHDLKDEEIDFLNKVEEKHEDDADWLSKLDQIEPAPESDEPALPTDSKPDPDQAVQDPTPPGGVLDRLRDTAEFRGEADVPQWLSDIKEEEDPQETAVLWLQQFVDQGVDVNIKDEIKRYTDELDPGVAVPKWMEDLKNEEDPQTTAMLWLEKLAADREQVAQPPTESQEDEDSGWLADLNKEAAEAESAAKSEEVSDFDETDQGWLSDLDLEEKLKTTDDELPDWSKPEATPEEVEPSWMKATSPLEGDFFTDELPGGEEKEVEIPEWLAGYAEGEAPGESEEAAESEDDEYTWLSASDAPPGPRSPLDLNKAAISQLEAILGISHQIAHGIVAYRQKHGPFREIEDLKNVPEIVDEQTIDILKPEVFIDLAPVPEPQSSVSPEPEPEIETEPEETKPPSQPAKKPEVKSNFEEVLVTARARISAREIQEAADQYALLIKKKKFLDEVIDDLKQAVLDFPLEISIHQTLGDAFMQKDMLDQALEAYSRAEDLLS